MIKLIINKPGLFLDIPGLASFRTPVEIDITKLDANLIISILKRNGITDYNIISCEKEIKKQTVKNITKNNKEETNNSQIIGDEILTKIENINENMVNRIEKLLRNFLNNDIIKEETNQKINKKEETNNKEIEEEDFIPQINFGKIKGSSTNKK